jgi:hypothetical protein
MNYKHPNTCFVVVVAMRIPKFLGFDMGIPSQSNGSQQAGEQ